MQEQSTKIFGTFWYSPYTHQFMCLSWSLVHNLVLGSHNLERDDVVDHGQWM